jgi:hypothetical protein
LSGSIPNSLSALTKLQVIWLQINQLSGSIPNSLSALSNLTWLYLNNNQLSGSIPNSLSALTNLTRLGLANNQLSGSIPNSLSALTNLQNLYLDNNQLSGCFPASLSFMCGRTTDFQSNAGLPGGGSAAAFTAFCSTGAGSDAFVASATASQNTALVGDALSLSTAGGGSYSWTAPAGALLGSPATSSVVSATLTTPGQKTFTVVISFGGSCTYTTTVSVTGVLAPVTPVSALTITGFAPTVTMVCVGSVATFTATVSNFTGPYAYTLTNGSNTVTGTTNTATFSQGFMATGSGSQSVTLLVSNGGAAATAVTILTVKPQPVVTLAYLNNGTVLQSTGGVLYERMIVIDRVGGYEIRQVDSSSTGFFDITRMGLFRLTVTGANGCQTVVESSIAALPR